MIPCVGRSLAEDYLDLVVAQVCIPPSTTRCLEVKGVMDKEGMILRLRPAHDGILLAPLATPDSLDLAMDEATSPSGEEALAAVSAVT